MVGRFVEQEQVGPAHQLAGQRQPLAPAAGENVGRLLGVKKAHLRQGDGGAGLALVLLDRFADEGGEQHVMDALPVGENVVLGEVAEADGSAQRARAGVRLLASGQQTQQRRFAGAVGTDQADALAGAEVERQVGEQRPRAVALGQPLYAQQHGHVSPNRGTVFPRRDGPAVFLFYCSQNGEAAARANISGYKPRAPASGGHRSLALAACACFSAVLS